MGEKTEMTFLLSPFKWGKESKKNFNHIWIKNDTTKTLCGKYQYFLDTDMTLKNNPECVDCKKVYDDIINELSDSINIEIRSVDNLNNNLVELSIKMDLSEALKTADIDLCRIMSLTKLINFLHKCNNEILSGEINKNNYKD